MLPKRTLRDLRDRALINFLITSGCRIAYALSLNRDDLQLDGFRVLGKGGKHRTVYVTEAAMKAVRQYLRAPGPDESPALWISVAYADRPGGRTLPDNRLSSDGAGRAINALRARMERRSRGVSAAQRVTQPACRAPQGGDDAARGDQRRRAPGGGGARPCKPWTLRVYTEITDTRKRAAYERLSAYIAGVANPEHQSGATR